jgi:hypothetical protein
MMKYHILILLTSLIPYLGSAQKNDTESNSWGFALNSGFNTEVSAIGLVPGASCYRGKSQFEFGVGFYPFNLKDQRIVSGEFNYKYFPNGTDHKFNLFLIMSCSYVNQLRKSYYPATYQYLFLSGGYGMQIRLFKGAYLGTSVNFGAFTNSKRTENPYKNYIGTQELFDKIGMYLDFQLNVGYRF